MVDGLAALGPRINDDAVTAVQLLGARNIGGSQTQLPDQQRIGRLGIRNAAQMLLGNQKDVRRSRGVDIAESQVIGRFSDRMRRNPARHNLAKNAAQAEALGGARRVSG